MESLSTPEYTMGENKVPQSEPVPDWKVARKLWGAAWELHWIGFGLAFSALVVSSSVALVQAKRRKMFGRKPYVIAINSLLLILGITRALYLLIDPYESKQNGIKMPKWFAQFLFNIAFPCLTSSFGLIFLVFLRVAKLQLVSERLSNARYLIAVISFHFAIVVIADIAAAVDYSNVHILFIICQLFFIIWGLLLSATFIYSGLKVIYRAKNVQKQLETQSAANTSKVAKVTIGTSCLGLGISALQLYSLVDVYRFYSDFTDPPPWSWWSFQTCSRLLEVAMACTIAYSVMKPSAPKRKLTVKKSILRYEKTAIEGIVWGSKNWRFLMRHLVQSGKTSAYLKVFLRRVVPTVQWGSRAYLNSLNRQLIVASQCSVQLRSCHSRTLSQLKLPEVIFLTRFLKIIGIVAALWFIDSSLMFF